MKISGAARAATCGRQSGRTALAMQAAPKDSVYVWCNHHLDYPKELARKLGREDLKIVAPSWITEHRWAGQALAALELDHAAAESFTAEQWRVYQEATLRVCSVRTGAGT